MAVAVLTAAVILSAFWLLSRSLSPSHAGLVALALLIGGTPAAAGILVTRAQPASRLGPLLALLGLLAAVVLTGAVAPDVSTGHGTAHAYLTAAGQGDWILVYVVVAVPLLFFPEGRLRSRAARLLLAAILLDAALFMVVAATAPGPFLPPDQLSPHVLGTMPAGLATALTVLTLPALPITLIALTAHLIGQYSHSDSHRRRQFRWLGLAAALLPLTLLATWLSYAVTGRADVVLAIGLTATYLALPALMAVGVLRPELFDVDRVISSTAAHAAFTAALLAVFTGADALAGTVLVHSAPTVAVAATALIAVLLAPARARVQRGIDRWLYPARKAAYAAIDRLHSKTLSAHARPEQLQHRLQEALHDDGLLVGYLIPDSDEMVDSDGRPLASTESHSVDISMGTERIGLLSARPALSVELLRDIAARAAPLVELVRLRVELRRALNEADQSRSRLLRVGYEERARLERDLHDGAQQRLVSLGMALRLAQRRLPRGGLDVSGVLDAAVTELATAVSELRRLAHGIRPSCLDDGLVPALSDLISSTPIPITLQVTASDLDQDLETTAYYVAAEAITNAIKHACPRHITLDVAAGQGQLRVRISDDGHGRAVPRPGSGLAGLADRVGAHGGTLAIDSGHGHGTVVEAVLPCASS
jgi:signal transduction histidine kinase